MDASECSAAEGQAETGRAPPVGVKDGRLTVDCGEFLEPATSPFLSEVADFAPPLIVC